MRLYTQSIRHPMVWLSSLGSAVCSRTHPMDEVRGSKRAARTNQSAFTLDVPHGWLVDGGLARLSALQGTAYMRMLAPDGPK